MQAVRRFEQKIIAALPEGALKSRLRSRAEDVRFIVVGTIGFSVNVVALWLFNGKWGIRLLPAQLLAAELAVLSNFSFHHNWTYRDYHEGRLLRRLAKFHASAWTGALIGTVGVWTIITFFHTNYLLAVAGGTAMSVGWNYLMNKRVIWAKHTDQQA